MSVVGKEGNVGSSTTGVTANMLIKFVEGRETLERVEMEEVLDRAEREMAGIAL